VPNFSKADVASCTHYQKTETVEIPWTNFTVTHKAETDHPCERPVNLYEWCINYLPQRPTTVLDPYMGSGSVGVACMRQAVSFVGIERERRYFDACCERIAAAQAQGRLFA
jgi:site-specific DNA-methyltransferase (adenine-specific)/modification methylase